MPPKISIIIPTLNEEEFLPVLLESIKKQTFTDYEIIVADAGSKDKTAEVAEKFGAKVVPGGMPGPGRNRGAEAARGEFLFFFDADVSLPEDFLESALNEMEERFLDLATCEFKPQSDLQLDKLMFKLANLTVKLNQSINPRAAGFCIFITRRLFNRVGGFDEDVKIAEDHDLVDRASKFRPLRFLNSTALSVSIRRLVKEGRFSLIEKYFHVELHLLTKGSIKDDIIEYEFGTFSEEDKKKNKKILDEIESRVIQLEQQYNTFTKNASELNDKFLENQEKWKGNLQNLRESFKTLLLGRKEKA
ncbi:MAG: glycosyltransferase [Leptospiraceae bacterium]|nr:glycosyltransferase [Leptospiraceae bacterium]MCP5501833.1 glycosyltransferase [Leptospiraceae bacterium]